MEELDVRREACFWGAEKLDSYCHLHSGQLVAARKVSIFFIYCHYF